MKYIVMVAIVLFSLVAFSGPASAEIMSLGPVSSFPIIVYGGGDTPGDLVLLFSTGVSGCESGIWMRPTDAGYNGTIQLLTAARMTNKSVTFYVETTKHWTGTSAPVCLIYGTQLNP